MTSMTSKMDVRHKAYEFGIKNPHQLNIFMRVVDMYAFQLARKMNEIEELPPVELGYGGREYLCRGCKKMKPLKEFPDLKQRDPSKNVNCVRCQGKGKYKCTGPCRQMKPLIEFPQAKRDNPRKPSPCEYCADKVITMRDAGHNLPSKVS